MKKKLAVFDMDGTLFDTGEANYRAYKEALRRAGHTFGLSYGEFMEYCFGKPYGFFLPRYAHLGMEECEAVHREKKELYKGYIGACCRVNQGLFDILGAIRGPYFTVLLTTASRENAYDLLSYYHCTDKFDRVYTAADVGRKKPDPEGYKRAMGDFGIAPQDAVVFDDMPGCTECAKGLGMSAYQVISF